MPTMEQKTKAKKKAKLRHAEYYDFQKVQDTLYEKSKDNCIFTNLMDIVCADENIRLAYRNLKKNKGSRTPGTDGRNIWNLADLEESVLISLVKKKFNFYRPQSVKRVEIPKSNGKTRSLGIPTILDRLIQQCLLQVLEPICEAKFFERNNGFRPNRSAENALAQMYLRVQTMDLHYVIDIDIKGFFDNVNHGKLLKQMWTLGIRDKKLIKIISVMLKAEVADVGFPEKGTPQGGIISPLLANIVLNELDWWIASQWENIPTRGKFANGKVGPSGNSEKGPKYSALRKRSNLKECYIIRYADDFKILCKNYQDARKLFIATEMWLKERLGLEISPEKSKIVNLKKDYSEFLGFKIKVERNGTKKNGTPKYTIASVMTEKAEEKIKVTMKELIRDVQHSPETKVVTYISRLNAYVYSTHNYYRIGTRVSKQLSDLAYPFKKSLKTRLKSHVSKKSELDKKRKDYRFPRYLYDRYKTCESLMVAYGQVLAPLWYCQHKNPMDKPFKVNKYTEAGRALIHDSIRCVDMDTLHYIMRNPIIGQSVEYNDNRISKYVAQKGRCAVSGIELDVGNMHCHHIVPRKQNGLDSYANLTLVTKDVHIAIHATNLVTLQKYLDKLNLDAIQTKKLFELREKAGTEILTTATK